MVHALVLMNITDPAKLAAYRGKAGAALAKHGGALAAAAPAPTVLEGSMPAPGMGGVLTFPDKDAAIAWINDPELATTHALRNAAGDSSILLLG